MERKLHTAYDGREIRAGHILKSGTAVARHTFEDQYIVIVDGVFHNGNAAKGQYCRESAAVIAEWLKD